jgi:hypothetical protein
MTGGSGCGNTIIVRPNYAVLPRGGLAESVWMVGHSSIVPEKQRALVTDEAIDRWRII